MKSVFLSIIIPCYNVAEYITQTIQSLHELVDSHDVEFIFVNDGSTDNTLSIIKDFVEKDIRAILIDQNNQGVSNARNNALSIAHGMYLLCLDGDDYLNHDTIYLIRNQIKDSDILLSPTNIIEENGKKYTLPIKIPAGQQTISHFLSSITVFPIAPQLIYKTSIIRKHKILFNSKMKAGEVLDFTFSVINHSHNITIIHDAFYNYVMRSSSAIHKPNCIADFTSLNLLHFIEDSSSKLSQYTSCKLTIYKIITSFVYSKYIRYGQSTPEILSTIEKLFNSPSYVKLLHQLFFSKHIPTNSANIPVI